MRKARQDDLAAILHLLGVGDLPTDDVHQQDLTLFIVAEVDGEIGAVGGLERCGENALLRSVATAEALRGQGRARAIVAELEVLAVDQGIEMLYLLTETAADFFSGLGYGVQVRAGVPEAVRASRQFSSICPASATVMAKRLGA